MIEIGIGGAAITQYVLSRLCSPIQVKQDYDRSNIHARIEFSTGGIEMHSLLSLLSRKRTKEKDLPYMTQGHLQMWTS